MKIDLIHYWNSEDETDSPFYPKEKDNFCINFQFLVGEKGEEGSEYFQVLICTPKWMLENEKSKKIILGRHRLIVFEYNLDKIICFIRNYIRNCRGDTFDEIKLEICELAYWEFEDYNS